MNGTNIQPPFFGPKDPIYPHLTQFVRVTGATVGGNVYPCLVQQSGGNAASSSDRENGWVWEPNGSTLSTNNYCLCRLIGSFTSGGNTYPLYETMNLGAGSAPAAVSATARMVIQPQFPTGGGGQSATFPTYSYAAGVITVTGLGGSGISAHNQYSDYVTVGNGDVVFWYNDSDAHPPGGTGPQSEPWGLYTYSVVSGNDTFTAVSSVTYVPGFMIAVGPEGRFNKNTFWQMQTTSQGAWLRMAKGKKLVQVTSVRQKLFSASATIGPPGTGAHGGLWYYDGDLYQDDTADGYQETVWVADVNNTLLSENTYYHAIRGFDTNPFADTTDAHWRAAYYPNVFHGVGGTGTPSTTKNGNANTVNVYTPTLPNSYTRSGGTITETSNAGIGTINGVTLQNGMTIIFDLSFGGTLSSSTDSGVYTVTDIGSVSTPYILDRIDYPSLPYNLISVDPGDTKYGDSLWKLDTALPYVPGTTSVKFVNLIAAAGTGGTGGYGGGAGDLDGWHASGGRYTGPMVTTSQVSTQLTIAVGGSTTVYAMPFVLSSPQTYSKLGAFLQTQSANLGGTATGQTIQIALYQTTTSSLLPSGAILARTGNIAVDTTAPAVPTWVEATAAVGSLSLKPGRYYLAVMASTALAGSSPGSCSIAFYLESYASLIGLNTSGNPIMGYKTTDNSVTYGTWPSGSSINVDTDFSIGAPMLDLVV